MIRSYEKNQKPDRKLFGISEGSLCKILKEKDVIEAQANSGMNLDKTYKKA